MAKAKLFKVLKEIVEETSKGERSTKGVPCFQSFFYLFLFCKTICDFDFQIFPEVELSGRVKDSAAAGLLKKQLGGLADPTFMDLKTGAIRSKKAKKERTPEQEAISEMKKLHAKWLAQTYVALDVST